jgi:hypothetical protein
MDKSTVANKRRVKGRKACVIVTRELSEMILDERRMVGQRRCQTADDRAVRSRSRRRQLTNIVAVYKDEPQVLLIEHEW